MIKKLFTKSLQGFVFAATAGLVFAGVLWIQAVEPGSITNPFFGPHDDDVEINVQNISCNWDGWYCGNIDNCLGETDEGSAGPLRILNTFCEDNAVTDYEYRVVWTA